MPGHLFIVSAPSGAGKTSLLKELVQQSENIAVSVSSTTRPMRTGEKDGVHYHFLDVNTFKTQIAAGDFLEHAQVFGNYYGTSRSTVLKQLETGQDVILEIDWQGARQARRALPDHTSVFILPPSTAVLKERLQGRATDDEAVIARRLAEARNEMSHCGEYDYLVVNDEFQVAVEDLKSIVQCLRLRQPTQTARLSAMLADLLD